MFAARSGHLAAVDTLLSHGAMVNAKGKVRLYNYLSWWCMSWCMINSSNFVAVWPMCPLCSSSQRSCWYY